MVIKLTHLITTPLIFEKNILYFLCRSHLTVQYDRSFHRYLWCLFYVHTPDKERCRHYFYNDWGGRDALLDLTTTDVCRMYAGCILNLKPMTAASSLSLSSQYVTIPRQKDNVVSHARMDVQFLGCL